MALYVNSNFKFQVFSRSFVKGVRQITQKFINLLAAIHQLRVFLTPKASHQIPDDV